MTSSAWISSLSFIENEFTFVPRDHHVPDYEDLEGTLSLHLPSSLLLRPIPVDEFSRLLFLFARPLSSWTDVLEAAHSIANKLEMSQREGSLSLVPLPPPPFLHVPITIVLTLILLVTDSLPLTPLGQTLRWFVTPSEAYPYTPFTEPSHQACVSSRTFDWCGMEPINYEPLQTYSYGNISLCTSPPPSPLPSPLFPFAHFSRCLRVFCTLTPFLFLLASRTPFAS